MFVFTEVDKNLLNIQIKEIVMRMESLKEEPGQEEDLGDIILPKAYSTPCIPTLEEWDDSGLECFLADELEKTLIRGY